MADKNFWPLTHGEILYILVLRARSILTTEDIARALGVHTNYLPTVYKQQQNLSRKLMEKVCKLFDVPPSLFEEPVSIQAMMQRIGALEENVEKMKGEIEALQDERRALKKSLIRCENENDDLRKKAHLN